MEVLFVLLGYLSGSILYARIFAKLFKKENIIEGSKDRNPGTANAFMHGGFWCGVLTLIFDILKGLLPVCLFMQTQTDLSALPFVMAAPVVGHVFPLFYKFKGGKGIATTFGCLLGLIPLWQPFVIQAVFFIFFSAILRITPHYHRTLITYLCSLLCIVSFAEQSSVMIGFSIITVAVYIRMLTSPEERKKMGVKLLWMR